MPVFNSATRSKPNQQEPAEPHYPIRKLEALPIIVEHEADDYGQTFENGSQLNSTFTRDVDGETSLILSKSSSSLCSNASDDSLNTTTLITCKPSNSSKHFENTYKLLGQHLAAIYSGVFT